MKEVSAALVRAQKAFGPALKSSSNPHFKSKYADLAACVEAVIDALNANGIALIQKNMPSEGGVCVETIFVHESGEQLSTGPLHVPASKQDAQGYGSALTYARRYSLMAACGIAPEDDDGNAASKSQPRAATPMAPKVSSQISAPREIFESLPRDWQEYLKGIAPDVANICEQQGPDAAWDLIRTEKVEGEYLAGLYSLLDSKVRSKLDSITSKGKRAA